MDRFLYFSFPFSSSGITIRIDAFVGGIRCYASDTNPRPSSMDYIWTLVITGYGDAFLDPSRLGRTPGSRVYVALQGVNAVNSFTLNTTIGDTSIQGISICDNTLLESHTEWIKLAEVMFLPEWASGGIPLTSAIGFVGKTFWLYNHFPFMQMWTLEQRLVIPYLAGSSSFTHFPFLPME